MPAAYSSMPSTSAVSAMLSCSKWRKARTSRSMRVHAVEGLLQADLHLGLDGCFAGDGFMCPRSWAASAAEEVSGSVPR